MQQNSFIVTIWKCRIYTKCYAVIVYRVYKGSLRFNTIATAFKESRENVIPLNNQEHVKRVTKLHNIIPTD